MKRYIVMSVPGNQADGSDTNWYVYDRETCRSVFRCGDFESARECVKLANHATAK